MSITSPAALSISDVAAATGLSTSTLRYYEQEGLLRGEIDRASSSHRRYASRSRGR
jgi:DNA-binding transcriptional MerR regulator